MMQPGTLFLHARILDPDWQPGPGERYADAPHATCRVTAVRGGRIYYRLATEPGKGTHYFHADNRLRPGSARNPLPGADEATREPNGGNR